MKANNDRDWLLTKAEQEDGCVLQHLSRAPGNPARTEWAFAFACLTRFLHRREQLPVRISERKKPSRAVLWEAWR